MRELESSTGQAEIKRLVVDPKRRSLHIDIRPHSLQNELMIRRGWRLEELI